MVETIPPTFIDIIPKPLSDLLTNGPVTNLAEWLHASALLTALMRMGLQASFNLSGKGLQDLDPTAQTHINALIQSIDVLQGFFTELQDTEKAWSLCANCMEKHKLPITESHWGSVLQTCSGNIEAARSTVINSTIRNISQEVEAWGNSQRNFAMDQVINCLTASTTPSLDSFIGDPRMIEWCNRTHASLSADLQSLAAGRAFEEYSAPWAADLLSTLKTNAESNAMSEAVDFRAARLAELKDQAEADTKAEGLRFYQTQLTSSQQQAQDEVDRDFAAFKHQLKVDTEARKDRARHAADVAVSKVSKSTLGRAGRKAKVHPMGSRPSSRSSSCTPSSPHTPTQPTIPLPTDKTPTKAGFPVGRSDPPAATALVDRYTSEADSSSTTLAAETQGLSAAAADPADSPVLVMDIVPDDEPPTLTPQPDIFTPLSQPPAPRSELEQIMMALAGLNTKIDGIDTKVDGLAARVLNLEDGLGTTNSYAREDTVNDGDIDMPTLDYEHMSEFDPDIAAQGQDEANEPHLSHEDLMTSLYLNIVVGIPIGDPRPSRIHHSTPNQSRFEKIAEDYAYRFQVDLSSFPLDGDARMGLSTFFWDTIKMEDKLQAIHARSASRPPITAVTNSTLRAPPMRTYQNSHTAAHTNSNNPRPTFDAAGPTIPPILTESSPEPTPAGWTTISRRKNTPSGPASFATVAGRSMAPAAKPLPPSAAQAISGLDRATLMSMTKEQVKSSYTLRFGGRLGRNHMKEAVVEAYLSKAAGESSSQTKPASRPPPKILQSVEFTVVCDPNARGLKAHNCMEGSKRRDAAAIVRQLQRLIRHELPPNLRPRAELIGGRWSSQSSSNFVLTFGGQPSNDDVLSLRSVFLDFFGTGSLLYPARGYTRVIFNLVPLSTSPPLGPLPSSEEIHHEMELNPVCQGLTIVSPPRWVGVERMKPHARHGSISFAFLDIDGSRFQEMKRQPPCFFGGTVRPKLFVSKPLIAQCSRCWRLGHLVGQCPKKADTVVCFICGGAHQGSDHQLKCTRVSRHDGLTCSCPVTCINCIHARLSGKGHSARDLRCPLRQKYRDPSSRTGMSSDETERGIHEAAAVPSLTARLDAAQSALEQRTSPTPAPAPTPSHSASNE